MKWLGGVLFIGLLIAALLGWFGPSAPEGLLRDMGEVIREGMGAFFGNPVTP